MKPDEQAGGQPTSTTGSNWQRQALTAARAGAAAAKHSDVASPTLEAARQRAAAQQVPDMLAEVDPAPVQVPAPAQPQQAQPSQPTDQGASGGDTPSGPVVSGALAPEEPAAGAPVVGTGGPSVGKKIAMVFLMLIVVLAAGAAGYFFLF